MDITQQYEDLIAFCGPNAGHVLVCEQLGRITDVLRSYLDDDAPGFYKTEPGSSVSYGEEVPAVVERYRELAADYGHRAAAVQLAEAFSNLADVAEKLKSQNKELPIAGLMFEVPPKVDPENPNKVTFSTNDPDTKLEKLFKKNMK